MGLGPTWHYDARSDKRLSDVLGLRKAAGIACHRVAVINWSVVVGHPANKGDQFN
jgi:hypothetical protein